MIFKAIVICEVGTLYAELVVAVHIEGVFLTALGAQLAVLAELLHIEAVAAVIAYMILVGVVLGTEVVLAVLAAILAHVT